MSKCDMHSSFRNLDGVDEYYPCMLQPKFRLSYINPTSGRRVERIVCGVHKNSLEKMCLRVNRRLKEDFSKLRITPIKKA